MRKLRIAFLSYRSNPFSGGQGIYVKYMTKALRDLGHEVTVFSGPPYPDLYEDIKLEKIPSLDLYSKENKFKDVELKKLLNPINFFEWASINSGGFSEPYTFGKRIKKSLKNRLDEFDVIHDNQSLCYEMIFFQKKIPLVTTIHHPISKDLKFQLKSTKSLFLKLLMIRWHSFLKMQIQVAKKLKSVIVVSESSKEDIHNDFGLKKSVMSVILNGIDTDAYYPDETVQKVPLRIVTTASADVPLKGLDFLLKAFASVKDIHSNASLQIIGGSKKGGHTKRLIKKLGIEKDITFNKNLSFKEVRDLYCSADIVVIPSLYEGFGFAVGEAMACKVPVITTSGGAIPEVIKDCGIIVEPGKSKELEKAILALLPNEELKKSLAEKGFQRIRKDLQWNEVAIRATEMYEAEIEKWED
ncbi:glycosyltransferase family 4 protein [SAR86 cluster bacterium]|nr:glycosyltransferase family 4 protein [SAR86 cluster bacterium]